MVTSTSAGSWEVTMRVQSAPSDGTPAASPSFTAPTFDDVCAADALVAARLTPLLDEFGISLEMFRALSGLSASQGCSVGDIARRAGTKPASTSRLVDRLVAENLAYRRGDELDRRRVLLFLSERGQEMWDELAAAFDARAGH